MEGRRDDEGRGERGQRREGKEGGKERNDLKKKGRLGRKGKKVMGRSMQKSRKLKRMEEEEDIGGWGGVEEGGMGFTFCILRVCFIFVDGLGSTSFFEDFNVF